MAEQPVQNALFHEDFYDALRDVVKALGGFKKVGADMQPEKPVDQAGRWLANALDQNRPEKLDPEQVLFLMKQGRAIGCHIAAAYISAECGYSDPQPIEPRDEMAELQRQYIESAKIMKSISERIERIQVRAVGGEA